MPQNVFTNFQQLAKGKNIDLKQVNPKASREWFRNLAGNIKTMSVPKYKENLGQFQNVENLSENSIGRLYFFTYDPKLKDVLPYYDVFPLVFPFDMRADRMLGINLHYLSPYYRAKLMDALYETLNNDKYNKTTKLKINYDILKGASQFKLFKPCLKSYLFDHVGGPFINIAPKMWDFTIALPAERFKKKSKDFVWIQSQLSV